MSSDAVYQQLSGKSNQIRTAQMGVERLVGEVSALKQKLAELEQLRTYCRDAQNQFIYTVSSVSGKIAALTALHKSVKAAYVYQQKTAEILQGSSRLRCASQIDYGIELVNHTIERLSAELDAKSLELSRGRERLAGLRYEYACLQRSL